MIVGNNSDCFLVIDRNSCNPFNDFDCNGFWLSFLGNDHFLTIVGNCSFITVFS